MKRTRRSREVVEPAGIVVDRAIARRRQRIDGEIAPFGVGLPVAAEFDLGMAAIGFDVLAQRRDLERMLVDHDGHRAVLDAGRHGLEARRRHALQTSSGTAVVATSTSHDRHAQQRVAHRAADDARLLAVAIEHSEQRAATAPDVSQAALPSLRRCDRLRALLRGPWHEFSVFHMRRHVGRTRRCAGEVREDR